MDEDDRRPRRWPPRSRCGRRRSVLTKRLLSAAALGLVPLVLAVSPAGAAPSTSTANWVELHPATKPPPSTGAVMAYDAATKQLIRFGGYAKGVLNQTWLWTGSNWQELHPSTSPSARRNAAMAFDPHADQLILYGGQNRNNGDESDTWTWTGSDWKELHPATRPSNRDRSLMGFDPHSNQLILFGGYEGPIPVHDTWAWTGSDWKDLNVATGPFSSRGEMAYYSAQQQLVLFDDVGERIFTFNGTDWVTHYPAGHPYGRSNGTMAYDPHIGQLVIVGGGNADHPFQDDTWTWNGTTWARLPTEVNPPPRWHASMAYDESTGQLILFGGFDSQSKDLDDTWTLKSTSAGGATAANP